MNYPCTIKEQDAQPYLAIRLRTSIEELPAKLRQSFGAIMAFLGQTGQKPAGMPFAAYHNEDMQNMDVEIGIPTAEVLEGQGEIYGAEIPAGPVAECVYTGSYNKLAQAYEQLTQFVIEQGVEPTGVAYEIYIDDPQATPTAELRTLILFPLKAVS